MWWRDLVAVILSPLNFIFKKRSRDRMRVEANAHLLLRYLFYFYSKIYRPICINSKKKIGCFVNLPLRYKTKNSFTSKKLKKSCPEESNFFNFHYIRVVEGLLDNFIGLKRPRVLRGIPENKKKLKNKKKFLIKLN